MRLNLLHRKKASKKAIEKALKVLTPSERDEFLKALTKRKDLLKPEHKIIFRKV
jgi:hypothetical protein